MNLHSPLDWPVGWKREHGVERSRFDPDLTIHRAMQELRLELDRLGATEVVLSTDLELNRDGRPSARQRKVADSGAALYYTHDGTEYVMPCDHWDLLQHNLRAITKTIEAMRGIQRWGAGQLQDAAFRGFAALPESTGGESWWSVLGVGHEASSAEITDAYRRLVRVHHPDVGGTYDNWHRIAEACQQGLEAASP